MLAVVVIACASPIDLLVGWPPALFRRLGHPVTWLGRAIAWAEPRANRRQLPSNARRRAGTRVALGIVALATAPAITVTALLPEGWLGIALTGLLAWPLVAARSLYAHVVDVARPLSEDNLPAARRAVAQIVGRDPARLDHHGVARAALESLAENTSDGVTAPLFWGVLFGLPGIAAYKAVNTLDSMIGHRSERYEDFGRFAARLDDAVNWVPARLTAMLFAVLSAVPRRSWRVVRRDARHHRSPNAGWPEAAMAGALGIRLSGPRVYGDRIVDEPWVHGSAPDPTAADLARGVRLYLRAIGGLLVLLVCAAALIAAV